MDVVDMVVYRFEDTQDPEAVRRAYCSLFDPNSQDARIVLKHLTGYCRWEDEGEYNDPVICAKFDSLRGVIRSIKKQINMKPVDMAEEGDVV
jgi:hypothetical protein